MKSAFKRKTRPLIKGAKAPSLWPRGVIPLERGSVLSRNIDFFLFSFFIFSFSPLRRRNGDFSSSRWLYSTNGVSLGGSCRRRKTTSPLTVALIDQGKRGDISRGWCRRRSKTVTVGESKGKDEFICLSVWLFQSCMSLDCSISSWI